MGDSSPIYGFQNNQNACIIMPNFHLTSKNRPIETAYEWLFNKKVETQLNQYLWDALDNHPALGLDSPTSSSAIASSETISLEAIRDRLASGIRPESECEILIRAYPLSVAEIAFFELSAGIDFDDIECTQLLKSIDSCFYENIRASISNWLITQPSELNAEIVESYRGTKTGELMALLIREYTRRHAQDRINNPRYIDGKNKDGKRVKCLHVDFLDYPTEDEIHNLLLEYTDESSTNRKTPKPSAIRQAFSRLVKSRKAIESKWGLVLKELNQQVYIKGM